MINSDLHTTTLRIWQALCLLQIYVDEENVNIKNKKRLML